MSLTLHYVIALSGILSFPHVPLHAQDKASSPACAIGGAVFGVDLLGKSLLVKDPLSNIRTVQLTSATRLQRLSLNSMSAEKPSTISLYQIQSGDLVCAVTGGNGSTVTFLSVVARADVDRAQQKFVAQWQKDSVYGRILSIDPANLKMTVTPIVAAGGSQPVTLTLARDVQCRSYPQNATQISQGKSIGPSDLKAGDTVYVHGRRAAGDPALQGTVLISGGVRGIIGAFIEGNALNNSIKIHEYGTGKDLTMQIPSTAVLYRTTNQLNSPNRLVGPEGVALTQIGLSDLQGGDIVLILGTVIGTSNEGKGLALITRFGSFAAVPKGDTSQLSWFLKSVSVGQAGGPLLAPPAAMSPNNFL